MPSALRNKLIRVLVAFSPLCLVLQAQCPVDTVIVKGRVEHPITRSDYRVRVQLVYPKHKPGESGEVTVEDANFSHSSRICNVAKFSLHQPAQKMWP